MPTSIHRALLTATVLLATSSAAFGISFQDLAGRYDILTAGDAKLRSAHVHGSVATGGDLILSGGMSEINMDGNYGSAYALVVKGGVIQKADAKVLPNNGTGQIRLDGGLREGQSVVANANQISLKSNGRSLILDNTNQTEAEMLSGSGFDVGAAAKALSKAAAYFAGLPPTLDFGSSLVGGKLSLSSATAPVDVLTIDGSQLAQFNEIDLGAYASGASKLIVNVDLASFAGGIFAKNFLGNTDAQADNVLWNFYGASSLTLQNQFVGSVLALDIDLVHQFNDLKGSVYADTFTKKDGQVHIHHFDLELPDDPLVRVPDAGATGLLALLAFPILVAARHWMRPRATPTKHGN